jgi:hypothetical protein
MELRPDTEFGPMTELTDLNASLKQIYNEHPLEYQENVSIPKQSTGLLGVPPEENQLRPTFAIM